MNTQPQEVLRDKLNRILKHHVWSAMGVGLIPFPLLDISVLTGIQLNLLRRLAKVCRVPFSRDAAKNILSSLVGGSLPVITTPVLATSLLKIVPGIGTAAGAITMSAAAGASTYAIGKVFIQHFVSGGTFLSFDPEKAKDQYAAMLEEGKEVITEMKSGKDSQVVVVEQQIEPTEANTSKTARLEEQIDQKIEKAAQLVAEQLDRKSTFKATDKQLKKDINTVYDDTEEGALYSQRQTAMKNETNKKNHKNDKKQEKQELVITHPTLKLLIGDFTVLSVVATNAISILLPESQAGMAAVSSFIPQIETILARVDFACSVYFILEALLKIWIFRFRPYWSSNWNKLDFFVVCSTLPLLFNYFLGIDLMNKLTFISLLRLGRFLRFLRFLRAARLIRLMRAGKTIWKGIGEIQAPVLVGFILIGARLGITSLQLSEGVALWVQRIFSFTMTLTIAWFITRIYKVIHEDYLLPWTEKTESTIDDVLIPFAKSAFIGVAWIVGIIMGLKSAGYDVGAIVAGFGIGGLAVAMAAKDLLANVLGGVAIFTKRPFRIGDRIEVAGVDGWVRSIGLLTTEVADFYGKMITLPNKTFTEGFVVNVNARSKYFILVKLHLRHDSSAEQVQLALNILKDAAAKLEHVENKCWVGFDTISDYSLDLEFWYAIKKYRTDQDATTFGNEYNKISTVKTQMNLEMMKQFEANQIRLALPIEMRKAFSEGQEEQGIF